MENPTTIVLSRLVAQGRATDVLAGNIANADTPGFKAERTLFSDWLNRARGIDAPPGGAVQASVQDRATYREATQGPMQRTGNPLDLALAGDGFFTVQTAAGPRLTRAGRFAPLPDGTLADGTGNALLDNAGAPMRIAPGDTEVSVTGDGTLTAQSGRIGRVGVVQPGDLNRMAAEGGRNMRADTATAPVAAARVVQGMLEGSNVQPVLEMTRMMTTLREFQFASQFVQSEADRQQGAIDKLTASARGAG